MEILRINNLTVGYGKKTIVSDINFQINKGEIAVVIGRNGSGKSTLLKTVAGVIDAVSGDIILNEKNVSLYSASQKAKIISSLFTEKIYADMMTCYEMIAMGRFPYTNSFGNLSKEDCEIIDEVAAMTSVKDLFDMQFEKLSDGQKQRVLLTRAIVQQPELLILDEPTSFLDIKYKLELLILLKRLAKEMDFAVLVSLHELDMAKQIADKIICIKDGVIQKIGNSEQIFADGYIKELFEIYEGEFDEKTGLGIF